MCGICGIVQIEGEPRQVVDQGTLDLMTDSMTHRGPNDRGTHRAPGIALGVRRLSIVDVAKGHQPFFSENGAIVAIQNGEIYNHEPTRRDLQQRGHVLATHCDTEVIPHLYEEAGIAYPERLRGKFGVAVWDSARRRAVLARDRLGVKPLYFARVDDLLIFGSELKSVLASGLVPLGLDYDAIDAYLMLGYTPGPRTPLAAVSKLLPGHRLVIEHGEVRSEPYWTFPAPHPGAAPKSAEEWTAGLLEKLEEAVKLRLMSDVPLGAMLSGGLDSSLIVALMARNMSEPVRTFSIGFAEDAAHNELDDARRVAEHFGTDHHELELSFRDETVDLETLVWHLDEPVADLSALGFLALSELAAQDVTVALSGQGADELLGGYKKHRAAKLAGMFSFAPQWARAQAPKLGSFGSPGLLRASRTLAARDATDRHLAMSGLLDAPLRAELFQGPLAGCDGQEAVRLISRTVVGIEDQPPLAATLHVDAQLALVDDMLLYFDRTSMAHSLEVRVPFLDHELVEYCAEIPTNLKIQGMTTKYLLKQAATGLVPDWVIHKKKLGFFRGASDGWIRAQMDGAVRDYLLDPGARSAEFIDRPTLERILKDHESGANTANVNLLLALLMLEIWLSSYLDRANAPFGELVPS